MNTPWGQAQHIDRLKDGIYFVSTMSHGGYLVPAKLAKQRIPEDVLRALFVGRYHEYYAFEEDCDSALFALYFPELCDAEQIKDLPRTITSMLNFCWSKNNYSHAHILDAVKNLSDRIGQ